MYDSIPSAAWGGRSLRRQLQPFVSAVFHASGSAFFFFPPEYSPKENLMSKKLLS